MMTGTDNHKLPFKEFIPRTVADADAYIADATWSDSPTPLMKEISETGADSLLGYEDFAAFLYLYKPEEFDGFSEVYAKNVAQFKAGETSLSESRKQMDDYMAQYATQAL